MIIRPEQAGDYAAVLQLTYRAFLLVDYPGRKRVDEHYLVHLLQGSTFVIPQLAFVAEDDGEIVGHILYTKSEVLRPACKAVDTITFGPLSVLPERHRQGIGAAIVRHSMEKACEMGFGAVLITGVPDYYPKLGFKRAREYGLTLPDGTADDSFMAYELIPEYLSGGGTLRFLPPEIEQSENDDAGFAVFHQRFMAENHPATLTLRPFFDGDISLMERWLFTSHVAQWYKHPDHWLNELRERRGAFSFLTHFIAEYKGIPIGFCQYCDTFFAQEHEVWNGEPDVGEKQGGIFSIDYLIGEPEYLRRGFGKDMIVQMLEMLRKIGAKTVIVEPEKENTASGLALKACGFAFGGTKYHFVFGEANQSPVNIRQIKPAEYPVLEEFLYHAIFVPQGAAQPPKEVIHEAGIYIYIDAFGKKHDFGVVAEQGGKIIGAAWMRIIPAYGHIDNDTPELAVSVLPAYRGQGIGTRMLLLLFEILRKRGYHRTSLSVQKANSAARLYQRLGYEIIRENNEDYIMVKDLKG